MKEASQKTALLLFLLRFLKLVISVATLSIAAQYFGVGIERESWLLTFNFVSIINLALWGPLNEIFRAKFIFLKADEGEAIAIRKTSSLLVFTLIVLVFISIIFQFFSLPLSKLIAPAYNSEELKIIASLIRFMIWSAIISQATQLLSSILNTYNSFYIPELSGFFSAIINFFIIIFLSKYVGIYSFVIANYISAIILLVALIYQVKKLQIPLFQQKVIISWNEIKPFILFSLPFFLPYLVGQLNGLLEKSIANLMGNGAVSIIDYSKKISEIIQSVLSSVLVTIMVPAISAYFAKGALMNVKEEAIKYLGFVLLILSFLIPFLMVAADSITHILFDKGSISVKDLQNIAFLMRAYSIGLISVFLYLIFGLTLLSTNNNKAYAIYGMVAQLIMMAINVLAYPYWGIYTFTISLTVSHFIVAIILFFKLPIIGKTTYGLKIVQYCSFGLVLAIVSLSINHFIYTPSNAYLVVVYNVFVLIGLGALLSKLFRISELNDLKTLVRKIGKT
jgi:peptidoglycan biosynthesis protein MviN/MurJ (putative lipid II flippase)